MNYNIDEEVVKLSFDNKNFEKNVSQSLDTIKLLNKELTTLSEVKFDFKDIEKASNNIKFDGIKDAIDEVNNRFSLLGEMSRRVFSEMANDIYQVSKKLIKGLTIDNVFSGYQKYNRENTSMRTMYNALSDTLSKNLSEEEKLIALQRIYGDEIIETTENFDELKDSMIDTLSEADKMDIVYEKMDKLSWFVDETSANYEALQKTMSSFISSGYDFDTAQTAVMGFSNMMANVGKSASETANKIGSLESILSTGSISLRVWNQIGEIFDSRAKQLAIDIATAKGYIEEGQVDLENFRSSLKSSKGEGSWLKADVLTEMFKEYTTFSNYVYKLTKLTDEEGNQIYQTADAMEVLEEKGVEALEALEAAGYDTAEAQRILDEEITDFNINVFKANQRARSFADAIESAKVAVSKGWKESFRIIFGNVLEAEKLWTGLANDLIEIFTNGAEARNNFLKDFKELDGIKNIITGLANILSNIVNIVFTLRDAIKDIISKYINLESLANFAQAFADITERLLLTEDAVNAIYQITKLILSPLKIIFTIVPKIIKIISPVLKIIGTTLYYIFVIIGYIAEELNNGVINIIDIILQAISKIIVVEKVLNVISKILIGILSLGFSLIKLIKNLIDSFRELRIFETIGKNVLNILKNIIFVLAALAGMIVGLISSLGKLFKNFITSLNTIENKAKVFDILVSIGFTLEKVWSKVLTVFNKIVETIEKIDFKKASNNISNLFFGIYDNISNKNFKGAADLIADAILDAIFNAINIVKDFLKNIGIDSIVKGIAATLLSLAYIVIKVIYNIGRRIFDALKNSFSTEKFSEILASIINNIAAVFTLFFNKLNNLIKTILTNIDIFKKNIHDKLNLEVVVPLLNIIQNFINGLKEILLRLIDNEVFLLAKKFLGIYTNIFSALATGITRISKGITEVLKAEAFNKNMAAFKKLIISVGILVVLIVGLSYVIQKFNIGLENITNLLVTTVLLLGALTLTFIAITKAISFVNVEQFKALTSFINSLAMLFIGPAALFAVFSLIDTKQLLRIGNCLNLLAAFIKSLMPIMLLMSIGVKMFGDASVFDGIGKIFLGIAALAASLMILQFVDIKKIEEPIEKVITFVSRIAIIFSLISLVSAFIAGKGKVEEKRLDKSKESITSIVKSLATITGNITKAIAVLTFMDAEKIKIVANALNSLLFIISLLAVSLGLASALMGNSKNAKFLMAGIGAVLLELSALLFILNGMDDKKIDKSVITISILTGVLAGLSLLFALASKIINPDSIIPLILGIGSVLLGLIIAFDIIAKSNFNMENAKAFAAAAGTFLLGMSLLVGLSALAGPETLLALVPALLGVSAAMLSFAVAATAFGLAAAAVGFAVKLIVDSIIKLKEVSPGFSELFEKLMGLLGTLVDILKVILDLVMKVVGFIGDIVGKGIDLISGIFGGGNKISKEVTKDLNKDTGEKQGKEYADGISNGIKSKIQEIKNTGKLAGRAAIEGYAEETQTASPSKEMVKMGEYYSEGLEEGINNNSEQVKDAGKNIGLTAGKGTEEGLQETLNNINPEIMQELLEAVSFSNMESVLKGESVDNIAKNTMAGFLSLFSNFDYDTAKSYFDSLNSDLVMAYYDSYYKTVQEYGYYGPVIWSYAIQDLYGTAIQTGAYTAEGLKEGVVNNTDQIKEAGKEAGRAVIEGYEEVTKTNSPSLYMKEDGKYYVIGLKEGIEEEIPVAKEKAELLGLMLIEGIENKIALSEDQLKLLGIDVADTLVDSIQEEMDKKSDDLEIDVKVKLDPEYENLPKDIKEATKNWSIESKNSLLTDGYEKIYDEERGVYNVILKNNETRNELTNKVLKELDESSDISETDELKNKLLDTIANGAIALFPDKKDLINQAKEKFKKKSGDKEKIGNAFAETIASFLPDDSKKVLQNVPGIGRFFGGSAEGGSNNGSFVGEYAGMSSIIQLTNVIEGINKLSEEYKYFGKSQDEALQLATRDTYAYADSLVELYKQQDKNFEKSEDGKSILSQEALRVKAMMQNEQNIYKSGLSQYDAFGFNEVQGTAPKTDYSTAKKNLQNEQAKINNFVEGFKRLAKAGLSTDLANVIQQEGYWNSPTYSMLDSMSDEEIRNYQQAIIDAQKAFDDAMSEIASTQVMLMSNSIDYNILEGMSGTQKIEEPEIDQNAENEIAKSYSESTYESIKNIVELANIDIDDPDVKKLLKKAAKQHKVTESELQAFFEENGYEWDIGEISEDDYGEPQFSKKPKNAVYQDMQRGLISNGIYNNGPAVVKNNISSTQSQVKQEENEIEEAENETKEGTKTTIKDVIKSSTELLLSGINQLSQQFAEQLGETLQELFTDLGDKIYEAMEAIGVNASEGLAEGVKDGGPAVEDSVEALGPAAASACADSFEEKSPSKLFWKIGAFATQGLANGISDTEGLAVASIESVSGNLITTFADTMGQINNLAEEELDDDFTITPVLDLSDIRNEAETLDTLFANKQIAGIESARKLQNEGKSSNSSNSNQPITNNYNFNQTNNSPKALTTTEIYRQSKNIFSQLKGAVESV